MRFSFRRLCLTGYHTGRPDPHPPGGAAPSRSHPSGESWESYNHQAPNSKQRGLMPDRSKTVRESLTIPAQLTTSENQCKEKTKTAEQLTKSESLIKSTAYDNAPATRSRGSAPAIFSRRQETKTLYKETA